MKKVLLLLFLMALAACQKTIKQSLYTNEGNALGTSYRIVYVSDKNLNLEKEIDSVFIAVNKSMSTYMLNSDISKINKGDSTVVVDAMFKDVFKLSKRIYELSNGSFDPTVGTLANAWGFGPGDIIDLDSTKVDSLLNYVGFDKVALKPDGSIQKEHSDIIFDFNAVAKGYTLDRLALVLDEHGLNDYLVELGGELVAKGENTVKQKPWTVGIDDPLQEEERSLTSIVALKNKALASSGNYRKYRIDENTGEKYVHTIDPKTGYTKNSNILATSVLADDCATADALATTFMVLELEESQLLVSKLNYIEVLIIYIDDEGEFQKYVSDGFKTIIVD